MNDLGDPEASVVGVGERNPADDEGRSSRMPSPHRMDGRARGQRAPLEPHAVGAWPDPRGLRAAARPLLCYGARRARHPKVRTADGPRHRPDHRDQRRARAAAQRRPRPRLARRWRAAFRGRPRRGCLQHACRRHRPRRDAPLLVLDAAGDPRGRRCRARHRRTRPARGGTDRRGSPRGRGSRRGDAGPAAHPARLPPQPLPRDGPLHPQVPEQRAPGGHSRRRSAQAAAR